MMVPSRSKCRRSFYIGRVPNSGIISGVEKDSQGYIITSEEMETPIPGVAGDIRRKPVR